MPTIFAAFLPLLPFVGEESVAARPLLVAGPTVNLVVWWDKGGEEEGEGGRLATPFPVPRALVGSALGTALVLVV